MLIMRKIRFLSNPDDRKLQRFVFIGLSLLLIIYCLLCLFNRKHYEIPNFFDEKEYKGTDIGKYVSIDNSRGRLANNIFQLAALYGISKYLKRDPIIYVEDDDKADRLGIVEHVMPELVKKFKYRMIHNFTNVQKVFFNMKCCAFDNPSKLMNYKEDHIHLTGSFFQSYKYFNNYREEIRNFVSSNAFFKNLPLANPNNFITCIHIRRSDFLNIFADRHSSDKDFIVSAREFIRKRENHPNMTTVLIGDDYEFESSLFENEPNVYVSTESATDDLIYSKENCDAMLITAPSSTFGWWLGYLSKGERVYYLDITTTEDSVYKTGQMVPEDFFDPKWTALKFDRKTKEVSLSNPSL